MEFDFINKILPCRIFISLLRRTNHLVLYRGYEKCFNAFQRKVLDLEFLKQCKKLSVIPKFIKTFRLPDTLTNSDKDNIHKTSLNRKIWMETKEKNHLYGKLFTARTELFSNVSPIIFNISIKNVVKCCSKELKEKKSRQNKKLATLLQVSGKVVDFQIEDTVMNLSDTALSSDEIEVLKYGLKHGLLVPIDCKEIKIKFENVLLLDSRNKINLHF